MKKIAYLSILFYIICFSKVQAQAVEPDARYLEQVKEYTLKPDGSWDYHYSHKLKLLSYYSIHTLYGEDFILYNPLFQKLKVNRSVTTMIDGTQVPSPENAFNELLPAIAVNAPAYLHLREMAITHTGLERGAIIDFDYTLFSKNEKNLIFSGNEVLWMNSPVDNLTFIIRIPSNTSLHYKQYNFNEKPVISKNGGTTTYCWVLADLPASTREDFRPRDLQNRPRIVFSTAKNADKLLDSFLNQPAFSLDSGEEIKKTVDEVRKNQVSDFAVMMRLHEIVANEVNYNVVPLALAGNKVRPAVETFQGNGGSELEKAVLLSSMLTTAGIKAFPVMILPERYFDNKTFNIQVAEKFLVKATDSRGEYFYLSPLQLDLQDQQLFLSGKAVIPLTSKNALQFEKEKVQTGQLDVTGKFSLNKEMEFSGSLTLSLWNRLNPFFKLKQDTTYARKLISGMIEPVNIRKLIFDKLEKEQSTLQFEFSSNSFIREEAGHFFIKIPSTPLGSDSWHMNELLAFRSEPLEVPSLIKESYRYAITLPEGYELITEEKSFSINKSFGSISIHISQEGRTVQIDRNIDITQQLIDIVDYAEFKALINTWNNKKYREIIIRVGPK